MFKSGLIIILLLPLLVNAQVKIPRPTKQQLAWHEMEFYLFIHFGPNTFTDKEWGHGDEPASIFNPTQLDCRQWARIAKQSGAKGIIITAKHHDGFCMWPSNFSKHTVRESKWKNGKGDVLKELSDACREYGLKFGVYISPWDRNHPDYGTDKYNDVFVNMMKEILTSYGPIWELWWDGANGEGANGKKQVYDWDRFKKTVAKFSPNTLVFSDVGPHIRWVGNEKGIAGETNWNTLDTVGFTPGAGAPHVDTLTSGNINGKAWIPAECDVSIRPGWFHHSNENDKVKSSEELFDLYLRSVGRGANLLLNVPPDSRGLIHENDSTSLVNFRKLIKHNFRFDVTDSAKAFLNDHRKSNWHIENRSLTDNRSETSVRMTDFKNQNLQIHFNTTQRINCVVLKESIRYGQNVVSGHIQVRNQKSVSSYPFTTIGRKRIILFPAMDTDDIFIFINGRARVTITEVEAYLIDERFINKKD